MTLIMKITDEGTQYADQLHDLLAEFGVNPAIEDEIDEISLLPAYVLAGASIRTPTTSEPRQCLNRPPAAIIGSIEASSLPAAPATRSLFISASTRSFDACTKALPPALEFLSSLWAKRIFTV